MGRAMTVVSLLLAILPGLLGPATYNPGLAVLTATLVTLVWYTFFTYLAATRQEPSFLGIRLERDGLELEPRVENPTRRSLSAEIFLRVWVGSQEKPQSAFYCGAEPLFLGPEGEFKGCVQGRDFLHFTQGAAGGETANESELKVMLRVRWKDDLGETGDTGPRYYRVPVYGPDVIAVVAETNIARFFPKGSGDTVEFREPDPPAELGSG